RVVCALLVTIGLARTSHAIVVAGAGSNGVGIKKDTHDYPLFGAPNNQWTIQWESGPNRADQLRMPKTLYGPEQKLDFDGGGSWSPGGRIFTGFTKTFGP